MSKTFDVHFRIEQNGFISIDGVDTYEQAFERFRMMATLELCEPMICSVHIRATDIVEVGSDFSMKGSQIAKNRVVWQDDNDDGFEGFESSDGSFCKTKV